MPASLLAQQLKDSNILEPCFSIIAPRHALLMLIYDREGCSSTKLYLCKFLNAAHMLHYQAASSCICRIQPSKVGAYPLDFLHTYNESIQDGFHILDVLQLSPRHFL